MVVGRVVVEVGMEEEEVVVGKVRVVVVEVEARVRVVGLE